MRKVLVFLIVVAALATAGWFLFTPDIPRAALVTKYARPPSEFMTLPGGARIHLRDRGPKSAPALVLIHGSNASLFTWEPWAIRLSDAFRVISIDMPGHGLTGAVPSEEYSEQAMTEVVVRVAERLKLTRFAIGGNSMGGGVAAH